MFVVKKNPTCWWTVKVKWPDEKNAGREITWEFDIEVKILDQDEIDAQEAGRQAIVEKFARDAATLAAGNADAIALESDTLTKSLNAYAIQTFVDTVTNWRAVFEDDESGKPVEVPFSEALFRQALKQVRTRTAIQTAINEVINGGARAKN